MQVNTNVKAFLPLSNNDWGTEMNRIMAKYLFIGAILAAILNPIFAIVDYLAINNQWQLFLVIRIFVTAFLIGCLLKKNFISKTPIRAGFVILMSVVTQDAYFYSLADKDALHHLSLSYLVDFVGAGMILLWTPMVAIVFLLCFIAINMLFFMLNSNLMVADFLMEGGLLVFAGAVFAMAMIVFRYHSVKAMVISKLELIKSNEWMAVQNEIIEEKSAELQKSNNRLKEFAYIISHDLKAPLRGIKNIASWIREDCGSSINEEGIVHLKLMEKQVSKMENLIIAVLEYSKTGVVNSQREWINLDEMIKDVIEMVEVDNNTHFTYNIHHPQIKGTRIVLSQVLQNLLSNSIKHNNKPIKEVHIEVNETANFFNFMVADNGPGIDPGYHEKIFDLFQNLRNYVDYESTGIGLAVSRKMIEESGGNLWLESEPGNGSRFYFSVPKAD